MRFGRVEEHLSQKRDVARFLATEGRIRELNIVSAYGDLNALRDAYVWLKKHSDARSTPLMKVFVDYHASGFRSNHEAVKFSGKLQKSCADGSGIYLVKRPGLFHSKVVLVKSNTAEKFAIGSMNFTHRGLKTNEEVMLMGELNGVPSRQSVREVLAQVKEYVKELDDGSELLTEDVSPLRASDLRQLLLDGFLLQEFKESEPFDFKLYLPADVLKVDTKHLHPLLSGTIADVLPIDRLIERSGDQFGLRKAAKKASGSAQPQWKRFCIPTCYGYWTPSGYRTDLDDALEKKRNARKPYYEWLRETINNRKQEIGEFAFRECERIAVAIGSHFPQSQWEKFDHKEEFRKRIQNHMSRLKAKLDKERYFDRLVLGVDEARVPDFSDDAAAWDDFESSFLDNLFDRLTRSRKTSVLARRILKTIKTSEEDLVLDDYDQFTKWVSKQIALGAAPQWCRVEFDVSDDDPSADDE